jgi:tRNA A37 threonylcarbamoyladenosine synthetase subunit TsaC/SUA5/YrdC
MTRIYNCSVESEYTAGMRLARAAIGRGALVVIPTDTVYGVAADAFNPEAVQRLLDAKGRDRTSPPPVLIPSIDALDALAQDIPQPVRDLVAEFWPGGLTVLLKAQPSLAWDLGETKGTVALRMPSDEVALGLLKETGLSPCPRRTVRDCRPPSTPKGQRRCSAAPWPSTSTGEWRASVTTRSATAPVTRPRPSLTRPDSPPTEESCTSSGTASCRVRPSKPS